jgi:hypothetical protein
MEPNRLPKFSRLFGKNGNGSIPDDRLDFPDFVRMWDWVQPQQKESAEMAD